MPFQEILKDLVDHTPGAVGAILVDWEGEAVQEHCHCDPYEIRFIAAHKGIILNRIRETHSKSEGGDIREVTVTTEDSHLLVGAIDKDYSLVMSMDRNRPLGQARYHFRTAVARMKQVI